MWHLTARVAGAEAAAAVLEVLDQTATAVSAFESGAEWRVDAYSSSSLAAPELAATLALSAAAAGGELLEFDEKPLRDRDWVAENQLAFPPLSVGRFFIYGSHYRGPVPAGRIGILIDAATAFGTGEHPSTRGCLLALEALARRRPIRRPLDIGAGSGILSIAAAKLLHKKVAARDIDAGAVRAAQQNCRVNGVAGLVRVSPAPGYRGLRGRRYDLVLANILARPLALMARDLARVSRPGGRAVLSGLLRRQENIVLRPHRGCGLKLDRRIVLSGWSTLIIRAGRAAPATRADRSAPARKPADGGRFRRPAPGSASGRRRYRPAHDRRAPSIRHRRAAGGAIRRARGARRQED
jgi:ribosomal protein L11 methyltransferase